MGQGDHSKQTAVTVKVPDPIVAFHQFQPDSDYYKKLQKEVQEVIWGSSKVELPPDYWIHVKQVFALLNKEHAIIQENILKVTPSNEKEEVTNYLGQLLENVNKIQRSYQRLLENLSSSDTDFDTNLVTSEGLSSCQFLLQAFADQSGLLFQKYFLTTPFLLAFYGIYTGFSKLFGNDSSRQRKEMESLENTLSLYKNACIAERLENIKMLRTQNESYNVHDYSYEAQVRKDVAFGGKLNDYYDKRPLSAMKFTQVNVTEVSQADKILEECRDAVKFQYDLLFCLEK